MYILIKLMMVAIFVWVVAYHNEILNLITKMIEKIREFIWDNKSFVDIAFLLSYGIIQLIFILQINKPNVNINLFVTLFVLALLTILGIERIFLKSRFNYLAEIMNDIIQDYTILKVKYNATLLREKQLIGLIRRKV